MLIFWIWLLIAVITVTVLYIRSLPDPSKKTNPKIFKFFKEHIECDCSIEKDPRETNNKKCNSMYADSEDNWYVCTLDEGHKGKHQEINMEWEKQ